MIQIPADLESAEHRPDERVDQLIDEMVELAQRMNRLPPPVEDASTLGLAYVAAACLASLEDRKAFQEGRAISGFVEKAMIEWNGRYGWDGVTGEALHLYARYDGDELVDSIADGQVGRLLANGYLTERSKRRSERVSS